MVRNFFAVAVMVAVGFSSAQAGPRGGGDRGHGGGHHIRHSGRWVTGSAAGWYCPGPSCLPAAESDAAEPVDEAPQPKQTMRYLTVKNETEENLTVLVQYRTKNSKGKWGWMPVNPDGDKALLYELGPGQEVMLQQDDKPILASRVRIWAQSQTSESTWMDNKDDDLWLVPETVGVDEEHCYRSAAVETFTMSFRPSAEQTR